MLRARLLRRAWRSKVRVRRSRDAPTQGLQRIWSHCTHMRGLRQRPGRRCHLPPSPHQILEADPARPRTICVGDIHGCLDELKDLLAKCRYDAANTRVVLVGDLVNKGPASAEVVRFVRTAGFACVRGNHDDSALVAWERREAERRDGGSAALEDKYAYTDAFRADDIGFLRALPHTILLPAEEAIVVHAGLVPGRPLIEQAPAAMITMRDLSDDRSDGVLTWHSKAGSGSAWADAWRPDSLPGTPAARHVIFGHDAKRGLQQAEHATGLDTGCCYGGRLTALLLPERRVVQVEARRAYAKKSDD